MNVQRFHPRANCLELAGAQQPDLFAWQVRWLGHRVADVLSGEGAGGNCGSPRLSEQAWQCKPSKLSCPGWLIG